MSRLLLKSRTAERNADCDVFEHLDVDDVWNRAALVISLQRTQSTFLHLAKKDCEPAEKALSHVSLVSRNMTVFSE